MNIQHLKRVQNSLKHLLDTVGGLIPTAGKTFFASCHAHAGSSLGPYYMVACDQVLGLSDTTVLAIYRDILKVSILRYFVINYRDTMPVHYCH